MDRGWIQFLLVTVPVLSLIGSWLALRAIAERQDGRARRPGGREEMQDRMEGKAEDDE